MDTERALFNHFDYLANAPLYCGHYRKIESDGAAMVAFWYWNQSASDSEYRRGLVKLSNFLCYQDTSDQEDTWDLDFSNE